jgi:predicted DNA-binding helix-hairpin-helix protein
MTRVLINFCSIVELMSLPGVGAKEADKILEMREAKGDLELEDLSQVPYLRLTPQLIKCWDFTPFEESEELGERRGSLDERYRERVRSVDQLVEAWEGRTGHRIRNGEGLGTTRQSPIKRGKVLSD